MKVLPDAVAVAPPGRNAPRNGLLFAGSATQVMLSAAVCSGEVRAVRAGHAIVESQRDGRAVDLPVLGELAADLTLLVDADERCRTRTSTRRTGRRPPTSAGRARRGRRRGRTTNVPPSTYLSVAVPPPPPPEQPARVTSAADAAMTVNAGFLMDLMGSLSVMAGRVLLLWRWCRVSRRASRRGRSGCTCACRRRRRRGTHRSDGCRAWPRAAISESSLKPTSSVRIGLLADLGDDVLRRAVEPDASLVVDADDEVVDGVGVQARAAARHRRRSARRAEPGARGA